MTSVKFTKMHGLGNDFMVVNNLDGQYRFEPARILAWSDRKTGIGFDQMLVLEQPTHPEAEFNYRIYNADGSEVEHCGNGARCFARYVVDNKLTTSTAIKVQTCVGMIVLHNNDDGTVTVDMGVPTFVPQEIPFIADDQQASYTIDVAGESIEAGVVTIGNPHVVLQVADTSTARLEQLGPLLEHHERFPNRVNVGFMQIINRQHINLRVFERGVGETRACGSGACAAVAVGQNQGLLDKTVAVTLLGGDLNICWQNTTSSIEMTGACSTVFEGLTKM
ncbi:MAG: diaminopimelate epimerase [Granulosicoccaceae bacterium]